MNTYTVIDFNTGKPITTDLTAREIKEEFNVSPNSICSYAHKNSVYMSKYKFKIDGERKQEQRFPQKLIDEWEEMTRVADLVKSGKAKIVTKRVKGKLKKYTEVIK